MTCKCGSQFLPLSKGQEKCPTCEILTSIKKNEDIEEIKKIINRLQTLCDKAVDGIYELASNKEQEVANKVFSIKSGLKLIKIKIEKIEKEVPK